LGASQNCNPSLEIRPLISSRRCRVRCGETWGGRSRTPLLTFFCMRSGSTGGSSGVNEIMRRFWRSGEQLRSTATIEARSTDHRAAAEAAGMDRKRDQSRANAAQPSFRRAATRPAPDGRGLRGVPAPVWHVPKREYPTRCREIAARDRQRAAGQWCRLSGRQPRIVERRPRSPQRLLPRRAEIRDRAAPVSSAELTSMQPRRCLSLGARSMISCRKVAIASRGDRLFSRRSTRSRTDRSR
jgi:hypothetical protein